MENSARALERCCLGDREAMEFLLLWRAYVHNVDDIIDQDTSEMEEPRRAEFILKTFALAIRLYSHPFYLRNIQALRAVAYSITNAYADSVLFERVSSVECRGEEWKQQWADHHRHAGAEMVLAVAQICGGYDHVRTLSPELRAVGWYEGTVRRDERNSPSPRPSPQGEGVPIVNGSLEGRRR